jgi:hypothetical protein
MPYQSEYDGQWYNDDGTPLNGGYYDVGQGRNPYEEPLDTWASPAPSPPPGGTSGTRPPGAPPTQPEGYHGIEYWQQQGYGTNDMFDENGQMRPGWTRTADGYAYTPVSAPSGGGGGGGFSFSAPSFSRMADGPAFAPPKFQAPAPFAYAPFAAPTIAEAEQEPGYAFSAEQGRKQLEATRAAQGIYRTGGTLKDIYAWANRFAEQNYGNVYNRSANTYGINRTNAADSYMTNYGVSRDVFDRDYRGSFDTYNFGQRNRELDFSREWDNYLSQLDLQKTLYGAGLD